MSRQLVSRSRLRIPATNKSLLIFLEYCWALVVILNGNSVYHASAVRNYYLLPLSVGMTVVLLVGNIALGVTSRIKKRNLVLAIALCLYAVVYYVVQRSNASEANFIYLFIIGLPCLFLLFAELHRRERLMPLLNRLVNVVCVLSTMSLFFWTFGTVLGILRPNMTTQVDWGVYNTISGYWGLHFQFQSDTTFGFPFYRNSGIFAEAPMLNLWCDLALAMELLLKKEPSKFKTTILVATIISTLSTTGFIFIVLCFGLKYFRRFKSLSRMAKALLLLLMIVMIPTVVYSVYSLFAVKMQTASFAIRMADYVAGFRLWLDHPLWGSGFGNTSALRGYVNSGTEVVGYSNSIMAALSTGGLWMALLYIGPSVGAIFPRLVRSKAFSCFSICFFYLFVTTIFYMRYLAVVMIALDIAVLIENKKNADRLCV